MPYRPRVRYKRVAQCSRAALAGSAVALIAATTVFAGGKRVEYAGSFDGPGATGTVRLSAPAEPRKGDKARFVFRDVQFACDDGSFVGKTLGPGTARFISRHRFHLDSFSAEGDGVVSIRVYDGRIVRGGRVAKGSIIGISDSEVGVDCSTAGGRAQWSAKLK